MGSMSIVGPRPVTEDELSRYGASVKAYTACRPGITGLWQVTGRGTHVLRNTRILRRLLCAQVVPFARQQDHHRHHSVCSLHQERLLADV